MLSTGDNLNSENVGQVRGAGTSPMEVRVLPLDRGEGYADWCTMFDRDPQANPFQHPDYVRTELAQISRATNSQGVMLRVGSETDVTGLGILLPKSVRTKNVGGVGPDWTVHGFRLAGGSFLAADHSPEDQSALLAAAIKHCAKHNAAFLLIEDLDHQSMLFEAVQDEVLNGSKFFAARGTQPRWRIQLPETAENYWKHFSGRTRRAFRTRLKRFGQTTLQRISNVEQIPDFLVAAHEISKQSWQSRHYGLRIRNDAAELESMAALAQNGFLRSYLWQAEGEPVAFAICTQHAGHFRYEEIAYSAKFSSLSPGETMLQQIVEDLYQHDRPNCFDFGGGDAEYKRRFGNRESSSQTVWLMPPTWRASFTLTYLNACRGVRSQTRRLIRACGMATKARQWLRYGGRSAHSKSHTAAAGNRADESDAGETNSPETKGD